MGSEQNKPLSEDERRLFRTYGRLPHGGGMLRQQCKERKYFDSGDFALSSAHTTTSNGAIRTGTAHPVRETISHPNAPVPSTSNVNKDANKDLYDKESPKEEVAESSLRAQTDFDENSQTPRES
ncbi:uncharacterized protein ATNIH1004_010576 [Aspergillus tanneri]|uniref:mRNA stability protein n=1 Tax=Aspergillus tanneri TaxID=1220188 RepID=A0A5M9M9U2_9EURO|nr:uncharacterized protein ATNIH1004_010576 [Aspergillus tanneri]KAA8643802.1 hypothetical protein ATNIH1004_010576 [Aspergillus tanneri]